MTLAANIINKDLIQADSMIDDLPRLDDAALINQALNSNAIGCTIPIKTIF